MVLETAMKKGACCWSSVQRSSSPSQTPSSSKKQSENNLDAPRSKNWHHIDYVLVRQRDIQDVCHTRVVPSAECYTDHRLVRCKLKLLFKPKPTPIDDRFFILSLSGIRSTALKKVSGHDMSYE